MKLGLESYSTRNSGRDAVGVLELANELGLEGVLFELSPFESFRDVELQRIRGTAEDKGLFIEFGMGSIFGWHPMAEKGRTLLADAGCNMDVSDAQIAIHHLDIARKLGSPILRCVCGNLFTRDEGYDMAALADQAVAILKEVCKAAEDMGIRIAMENHADFTVRELISILGRINSPAFGFTVDCANLAFDLDDPLRLAGILAPWALTTHYKNYRIVRTKDGLGLENCALGEGDIDIVAIARLLAEHNRDMNINIELHTQFAPFKLDILDPTYFQRHPSPPGDGLAWYLRKSWEKDILRSHPASLPDGEISWELEYEHLKSSVEWAREALKSVLSA
ncbi:MAG TPA: TIM barrel protein [bacterium]|nr:TIM barrel protein [bacterium]HQO33658.1 TIM barrel protein [bacterium]HQP99950.1 TIM barrel protein [bacterium]